MSWIPLALSLFLIPGALAAKAPVWINGKVVKVADGDTITVLEGKKETKIRIFAIDAPEKSQPFGKACKEKLTAWVAGKDVRVKVVDHDRYGRSVGQVFFQAPFVLKDVGLGQVEQGCAWHYKQFSSKQTKDERESYERAEKAAHEAKRGLWAEARPEAPWSFRHAKRDQGKW